MLSSYLFILSVSERRKNTVSTCICFICETNAVLQVWSNPPGVLRSSAAWCRPFLLFGCQVFSKLHAKGKLSKPFGHSSNWCHHPAPNQKFQETHLSHSNIVSERTSELSALEARSRKVLRMNPSDLCIHRQKKGTDREIGRDIDRCGYQWYRASRSQNFPYQ